MPILFTLSCLHHFTPFSPLHTVSTVFTPSHRLHRFHHFTPFTPFSPLHTVFTTSHRFTRPIPLCFWLSFYSILRLSFYLKLNRFNWINLIINWQLTHFFRHEQSIRFLFNIYFFILISLFNHNHIIISVNNFYWRRTIKCNQIQCNQLSIINQAINYERTNDSDQVQNQMS